MAEKRIVQLMRLLAYPSPGLTALPASFDADKVIAVEQITFRESPERLVTLVTLDNSLAIATATDYAEVLKLVGWKK